MEGFFDDYFYNNSFSNGIWVKNVNKDRYKIGNLYHKYLKVGGPDYPYCQAMGCPNPAQHTAHVKHDDGRPSEWYLVRTCAKHNNHWNTDPYPLYNNTIMVPLTTVRYYFG